MEEKHASGESGIKERFIVRITSPMPHDRLHTLSVEYTISEELLVNIAVKRLIDDVELVRNLRLGRMEPE